MFFCYKNHTDSTTLGSLPRWMVIQADSAPEANAKLVCLVGQENVSTSENLGKFDPFLPHFSGYSEPRVVGCSLANAKQEWGTVHWHNAGEYRVVYLDGTVVTGQIK